METYSLGGRHDKDTQLKCEESREQQRNRCHERFWTLEEGGTMFGDGAQERLQEIDGTWAVWKWG